MNATESDHWQTQRERSSIWMLRLLMACALLLGRRVTRIVLAPIVGYFLLFGGKARLASREYLSKVLGRPVRLVDVARHFYTFAGCALDRVYLLTGRHRTLNVQVHGAEVVLDRVGVVRSEKGEQERHGALLFVSHFGSFEVLRAMGEQQHRLEVSLLMDRAHGRMLTSLMEKVSPTLRPNVIDASQGGPDIVLSLSEAVRAGRLVGVMADRARIDERTISVDFLGEPANFPISPWMLASVLKVPVIMGLGIYQGGNRYSSHFELLTEQVQIPRNRRESALQEYVQAYANRLAHYTRLAPYNWFNFYRFWS